MCNCFECNLGLGFLFAFHRKWLDMKEDGKSKKVLQTSLKDFIEGCANMRVIYEFYPTWDAFEERKWRLADEVSNNRDALVLQGVRKALAVQSVQNTLKENGKAHNNEALAKFFTRVKNMSAKVIGTMLKISDRFTEASGTIALCYEMDSKFDGVHCLSNTSVLDLLCQKTSKKKGPGQDKILFWVVSHLHSDIMSGKVPVNLSQRDAATVISRYLLKKRLIAFLGRYGCKEMVEAFESVSAFSNSGLANPGVGATHIPWLADLPEYSMAVVMFLGKVMRGTDTLYKCMDAALARDPLMPAEARRLLSVTMDLYCSVTSRLRKCKLTGCIRQIVMCCHVVQGVPARCQFPEEWHVQSQGDLGSQEGFGEQREH